MKRFFLIGLLFLMGCYEYMPPGLRAQVASEKFLDSLYKPKKINDKVGIDFISIQDYLNPSKQKIFQQDTSNYRLSQSEWIVFTKKLNDILSKVEGRTKGFIHVEKYRVNDTQYTTAFLVDSTYVKVFATIQLK